MSYRYFYRTSNSEISIYFSDADDGNIAFHVDDDFNNVRQNRTKLVKKLDVDSIHYMKQTHSTDVYRLQSDEIINDGVSDYATDSSPEKIEADVLIAADGSIAVMSADCVPLVLIARNGDTVIEYAVIHAGRVGLLNGVIQNTIEALNLASIDHIDAIIGPHICQSCYEVSSDLYDSSRAKIPAIASSQENYLDLFSAVVAVVQQTVSTKHISLNIFYHNYENKVVSLNEEKSKIKCTYESNELFSYRRATHIAEKNEGFENESHFINREIINGRIVTVVNKI